MIRKLGAGALLLLLTLALLPGRWLHDALADHEDAVSFAGAHSAVLSGDGYDCGFEDLALSESGPSAVHFTPAPPPPAFSLYAAEAVARATVAPATSYLLRGPPARA